MKLLYAVIGGLAATAAMTAFLYLMSYVTHRVMKVTRILGTMLMNRTQPDGSLSKATNTKVYGTVAHYLAGIIFALFYIALWHSEVGLINASWGFLFGLAHGLMAMFIWYLFFMVHPRPPLISLRTYLTTLIFAHIVFGLVLTYTVYLLAKPDYPFWSLY
ncbi:hypothetical protein [Pontibacter amylolyticus]|uniref:DUF2938 domain-containing protein n=1 Tax=Pontibacter amylolyticus TaxID=1424080 RepID=A0ABQ1W856_9BACT|nr:hypothetical protein [Pontibacter amylolyticus]GGG19358.1 hypothetical protein GCM10011323_24310 [Pontibacter amylolyticus]